MKIDLKTLNSLEWEFWNQSIHKKFSDKEEEFNNHIDLFMGNLLHLDDTENVSLEDIKKYLKKFWDEATKKRYVDMHVNSRRFEEFKNKISKLN